MSSVLPALRELFSQRPETIRSGPESLSRMLYVLCYLNSQPDIFEVEAALEVLRLEGAVAA
jgi:hypothetical protein